MVGGRLPGSAHGADPTMENVFSQIQSLFPRNRFLDRLLPRKPPGGLVLFLDPDVGNAEETVQFHGQLQLGLVKNGLGGRTDLTILVLLCEHLDKLNGG